MAIFSRKSKAEKKAAKAKSQEPPEPQKPANEPYKHVPRHAASDSSFGTSASREKQAEMERIMAASQQRMNGMTSNRSSISLKSAHLNQVAAHNAMYATPSPSSVAAQQQRRPYYGMNGRSPNQSAEVFTTDPDAPPMPLPSSSSQKHHSQSPRPTRNNSGYFSSSSAPAPSFDNASTLANPKMAAAARDRGYVGNPHNSADSGYGSVAASTATHSRAPSENNAPQDVGQSMHLPQKGSNAFLPQMSLSEELAQDPAFSEHSFDDDHPIELVTRRKVPEPAMKKATNYVSQLDPASENSPVRPAKQSRPSRSSMKQTRFVAPADPMSEYAQDHSAATSASSNQTEDGETPTQATSNPHNAETQPSGGDESLPNFDFEHPRPRFAQQQRTSSPARPSYGDQTPSFSRPMRTSNPATAREQPESQNFASSNPTAPSTTPARYQNAEPQQQRQSEQDPPFRSLHSQNRINQSDQIPPTNPERKRRNSTLPPLSILQGYKVNKKGRVLDEEGDVIGELAEGDIIDCVRQKVNALGQVMDEYGSIVGQVKTLPRSIVSPSMQAAAPAVGWNNHQHSMDASQSQQYSRNDPMQSNGVPQDTEPLTHSQERAAAPVPHVINKPAVYPLEYPDNATHLELDGSTHAEAVPIMDHSEIFAPPFVPSRSPKRGTSPVMTQEQFVKAQTREQQPPRRSPSPPQGNEFGEHGLRRWASRNFEEVNDISEPVSNEDDDDEPRAPPSPIQYQQHEPIATAGTRPPALARRSEDTQAMRDMPGGFPETPGFENEDTLGGAPEGNTFQERTPEALPQQSPALFAYKGDIPAVDGPPPGARLPMPRPASVSQAPSFMRQGLTTNGPFSPPNSIYMNAAPTAPVGRFNTMTPGPRSGLTAKNSLHTPMRKSPLSSSQSTPPESDDGYHEGTTVQTTYSRPQSLRSVGSHSTTTNTKTRTYFTHSGKITLDGSKPAKPAPATISEVPQQSGDATSTKSGKTAEKKKGRFSLSLGRKGSTAAAH